MSVSKDLLAHMLSLRRSVAVPSAHNLIKLWHPVLFVREEERHVGRAFAPTDALAAQARCEGRVWRDAIADPEELPVAVKQRAELALRGHTGIVDLNVHGVAHIVADATALMRHTLHP